ncbi:unnamed protein product [Moneuplotes crassus]|uniref:Uncharacterized protein n=1 Tax=Euplotes crassus TaxID=5936 RepID=A0AAD1XTS7_EUPCR|nr:unnamed protein product [Moneuplotes crassus]
MKFISDICFCEREVLHSWLRVLLSSKIGSCIPHCKLNIRCLDEVYHCEVCWCTLSAFQLAEASIGQYFLGNLYILFVLTNFNRQLIRSRWVSRKIKKILNARKETLLKERNLSINISFNIAGVLKSSWMVASMAIEIIHMFSEKGQKL